jgi:hypothetical protein
MLKMACGGRSFSKDFPFSIGERHRIAVNDEDFEL